MHGCEESDTLEMFLRDVLLDDWEFTFRKVVSVEIVASLPAEEDPDFALWLWYDLLPSVALLLPVQTKEMGTQCFLKKLIASGGVGRRNLGVTFPEKGNVGD